MTPRSSSSTTRVRPGGFLSVFLYSQHWRPYDRRRVELFRDLKWLCFSEPTRLAVARLPHPLIVAFCAGLYARGLLITGLRRNRLTRWAAALLEQVTPPGGYLPGEGLRANIVWNYDGYSTRYLYQISLEESLGWFRQAGYNDLTVSPFPLSVTGWRRGTADSEPLRIRLYAPRPIEEIERP